MKNTIAGIAALLVLTACGATETEPKNAAAAKSAPAAKAVTAAEALAEAAAPVVGDKTEVAQMGGAVIERVQQAEMRGTVLEAQTSAGFTYARLKTSGGEEWVVLSNATVAKGDKIALRTHMVAEKFQSQSLKRTFDKVTFGELVSGGKPAAAAPAPTALAGMTGMQRPANHPAASGGAGMQMPAGHGAVSKVDTSSIKVDKAEGPDAKTVAEIWAGRTLLGDGPVVVRGKVVKVLGGIMGRNWVHIRDGSGSAGTGDDDITVTTVENVKAGDIVTVKGIVRVDKDFGAGYKYAVIIEDGTFK